MQARKDSENMKVSDLRNTYWLTRVVLIRSLAFIYCK